MKGKIISYSISIVFLILFVFVLTYSYLNTNFSQKGNIDYKRKYYDIVFNNVTIDADTTMKVKLDSDSDTIKIKVEDLNELIKNIRILNTNSNVQLKDVNIDISTNVNDIINGGETKKLIICITYNKTSKIENPYYFFDIKYDFDEVIL